MANTREIQSRMKSIQDTMKITNAMYLISSSKLRKARQNYQNVLPYFTRMRDTISRVVPHLPDGKTAWRTPRTGLPRHLRARTRLSALPKPA